MNKAQFEELLESVREMDGIVAGKRKASRTFKFPAPTFKKIREKQEYPKHGLRC